MYTIQEKKYTSRINLSAAYSQHWDIWTMRHFFFMDNAEILNCSDNESSYIVNDFKVWVIRWAIFLLFLNSFMITKTIQQW